jgi:hypothetical protein
MCHAAQVTDMTSLGCGQKKYVEESSVKSTRNRSFNAKNRKCGRQHSNTSVGNSKDEE